LGGALAANEDKIQEAVVAEVVKAFRKQAAIDEIIRQAASLSPPMFLTAKSRRVISLIMIMIEKVPYSHETSLYNLFICFKKMRTYKNFMSLPIAWATK
jgi:hypothetical protein